MSDIEWIEGYYEGFDAGRKDGYKRGMEDAAKIVKRLAKDPNAEDARCSWWLNEAVDEIRAQMEEDKCPPVKHTTKRRWILRRT